MLIKIVIVLAVIVIGFLMVASRPPTEFRIVRSMVMSATPAQIFLLLNDLHAWHVWSPWAKMDTQSTTSFAGPAAGVGAAMTWSGNIKVGEGTMTILESRPNERIQLKLEFRRPLVAANIAEFTFVPQGSQTQVAWTMTGHNNIAGKAMGLIMDCDKMVGSQFEKGLAQLNVVAQSAPR